jgi:hypothetical protein
MVEDKSPDADVEEISTIEHMDLDNKTYRSEVYFCQGTIVPTAAKPRLDQGNPCSKYMGKCGECVPCTVWNSGFDTGRGIGCMTTQEGRSVGWGKGMVPPHECEPPMKKRSVVGTGSSSSKSFDAKATQSKSAPRSVLPNCTNRWYPTRLNR